MDRGGKDEAKMDSKERMNRAFYLWQILQFGITVQNVGANWEFQDLLKQMTPEEKIEVARWDIIAKGGAR